jgi:hypothetical protein
MPKLIATGASPSEVGAKAAKSEPILTWDNLTYSVNNGAKTIIDDCSGKIIPLKIAHRPRQHYCWIIRHLN